MKKKSGKKTHRKTLRKKTGFESFPLMQHFTVRYIIFASIAICLLFAGKLGYAFVQTPRVLGASVFLADHGSDDSGGTSGDTSGSSGGGTSGGDTSGGSGGSLQTNTTSGDSGSSGSFNDNNISGGGSSITPPANTLVDCVGPDGRHFQTIFQACAALNQAWGHSHFSFTKLQSGQSSQQGGSQRPRPAVQNFQTNDNSTQELDRLDQELNVTNNDQELQNAEKDLQDTQTENKVDSDLQTPGTQVELEPSDNQTNATLRKSDGTSVAIDKNILFRQMNNLLKPQDIEIGTGSAHGLRIRKGQAQAETDFPLSIDPTTKTLTVTTPAGVKQVTILPDRAVENALHQKIFTNIQSENTDTGSVQQSTLTQVNNQPVFKLNGVANKHFLGIIPMSFAKTAFISAETGNVVKIKETFLSKLLESLSL